MKLTRDFYIPAGAAKREYPELAAVVYTAERYDKHHAVCFGGKRTKPDINSLFKSAASMEKAIQDWLDGLKRRQEYKVKRRAENVLSSSATSAKLLKTYLQEFFPGVKFSVKSKTFSGGDSIRVSYTDGPLYEEVSHIAGLFQYGDFDGMTDSYNYRNIKIGCTGAKYVFVDRNISPDLQQALLPILKQRYAPRWGTGENIDDYAVYQVAEAEKIYRGLDTKAIEQATRERIELITTMGTLAG